MPEDAGVTLEQTDEALAREARAGSLECFEELVRRYQVPLLRFLQRRLPTQHDAEDVIQEAFLRAYQAMPSLREGQAFKPWLFTIAYRLAVDASRRRWPRSSEIGEVATSEQGPSAPMEASDAKSHLWKQVRRALKDEPFTVVWLHYAESMSTSDIARVTGRSRVWVKTALVRSRGIIREKLESAGGV